jgi:serine/threonine protein kinase
MEIVYKAENTRLERTVALKFYKIDEEHDQTFISMEYIQGQSLKDKLETGALDTDEAKDVALQVAGGSEKAHKKAIIGCGEKIYSSLLDGTILGRAR